MSRLTLQIAPGTRGFPGKKKINTDVELILQRLPHAPYHMTLHLIADAQIRKLNRKYRKIDRATDVLSFPLQEFTTARIPEPIAPVRGPGGILELGDVFIAMGVCKKQAEEIGHSVHDEFYRLMVHGILHLVGYDHERSSAEEKRMIQKEDELLALIQ